LFKISAGLTTVVSGIQGSSNQVLSGSDELANVSQALAEGATMQTMAVETLLTTTNKIMEEVEANRVKAEESAKETERVTGKMEENQELMNRMASALSQQIDTGIFHNDNDVCAGFRTVYRGNF